VDRAFIGINDIQSEGTFVWWQGKSSYKNWCLGEPNDTGRDEDCTEILLGLGGCWNDNKCHAGYEKHYICERTEVQISSS